MWGTKLHVTNFQDNFAMAKNVKMNPQYIDEIYFLQLQCINTTAQVFKFHGY